MLFLCIVLFTASSFAETFQDDGECKFNLKFSNSLLPFLDRVSIDCEKLFHLCFSFAKTFWFKRAPLKTAFGSHEIKLN